MRKLQPGRYRGTRWHPLRHYGGRRLPRRRGLLVMTNAGNPPAFGIGQIAGSGNGSSRKAAGDGTGRPRYPLGLLPNVSYDWIIIKPEPGDLIVLYSDGVSEATNAVGKELGRDDLMTWPGPSTRVRRRLRRAVGRRRYPFRGDRPPAAIRPSSSCRHCQSTRAKATLSKRAQSTTLTSLRLESSTYARDTANCVRPPKVPRSLTAFSSIDRGCRSKP